ncbi:MAG: glycosyltransferase family 9 protein [Prevotella sp.]
MRFSAIGDVAMTVPVVKALAAAYPETTILVASRPFAKAFYEGLADNVEFHAFDLKAQRYRGMAGMEHLYRDLSSLQPDCVADLHDVLRTKYARLRFCMAGIRVFHIDKHRSGRRRLTRRHAKTLVQQPTSFEKYHAVFEAMGMEFSLSPEGGHDIPTVDVSAHVLTEAAQRLYDEMLSNPAGAIGIAPFAAHEGKIYPIYKMEQVMAMLIAVHPRMRILLFGGGKREEEVFRQWESRYANVVYASSLCGGMRDELKLMSRLHCMLSMDSGNMHLASLVGTPVISVWGATHPLAGFMGWGQSEEDTVGMDMACRPCSIYGNKPCYRGGYPCMKKITPEQVAQKVERYIFADS